MTATPRVDRSVLTLEGPAGLELELPRFEARGASDGPRVTLMAGVHGCEYTSIAAVTRFMRGLDPASLSGSVVGVPLVNPSSFWQRRPFVVPEDGKNLNRCFPGSRDGTYSEVLAAELVEHLIHGSDYLIDLHAGDMVEDLAPFALYQESPVEAASEAMALAYGLGYVVRTARRDAPIDGTASGAASASGIPAITAESGGRGLVEEEAVARHVAGVRSVMGALGLLPQVAVPDPGDRRRVGRFVWLHCGPPGWWEARVAVGQSVGEGEVLGVVLDAYGEEQEQIVAPEAGVPLFLTTSPAVAQGGLVAGLGTDLRPLQ